MKIQARYPWRLPPSCLETDPSTSSSSVCSCSICYASEEEEDGDEYSDCSESEADMWVSTIPNTTRNHRNAITKAAKARASTEDDIAPAAISGARLLVDPKNRGSWSSFIHGVLFAIGFLLVLQSPPPSDGGASQAPLPTLIDTSSSGSNRSSNRSNGATDTHANNSEQRYQPFLDLAVKAVKDGGRHVALPTTYAIVATMKQHPHDLAVQHTGCQVLRHLAQHGNHRHHIRTAGGIPVVLSAMAMMDQPQSHGSDHRENVNTQIAVCANHILSSLGTTNAKRQTILWLHGASIIVQSMNRHRSSVAVQSAGCAALASLGRRDSWARSVVIAADGLEVIRQALGVHGPQVEDACVNAEKVLNNRRFLLFRPSSSPPPPPPPPKREERSGRRACPEDAFDSAWKFTRTSAGIAWGVTRVSASLAWDVTRLSALVSSHLLRATWNEMQ